jgi:hypothetical protein
MQTATSTPARGDHPLGSQQQQQHRRVEEGGDDGGRETRLGASGDDAGRPQGHQREGNTAGVPAANPVHDVRRVQGEEQQQHPAGQTALLRPQEHGRRHDQHAQAQ